MVIYPSIYILSILIMSPTKTMWVVTTQHDSIESCMNERDQSREAIKEYPHSKIEIIKDCVPK